MYLQHEYWLTKTERKLLSKEIAFLRILVLISHFALIWSALEQNGMHTCIQSCILYIMNPLFVKLSIY